MGVYEIPEPTVFPMPTHASYQSENAPFLAGALGFGGEAQYLAFAAGDYAGFADLKSGETQIHPPETPRGWFNKWRLLQRGPYEFEEILAVDAADPLARGENFALQSESRLSPDSGPALMKKARLERPKARRPKR